MTGPEGFGGSSTIVTRGSRSLTVATVRKPSVTKSIRLVAAQGWVGQAEWAVRWPSSTIQVASVVTGESGRSESATTRWSARHCVGVSWNRV